MGKDMAGKLAQNSGSGQEAASDHKEIPKATATAAEKIGKDLHDHGMQSMGKADSSYNFSPPSASKAITKEQGRSA